MKVNMIEQPSQVLIRSSGKPILLLLVICRYHDHRTLYRAKRVSSYVSLCYQFCVFLWFSHKVLELFWLCWHPPPLFYYMLPVRVFIPYTSISMTLISQWIFRMKRWILGPIYHWWWLPNNGWFHNKSKRLVLYSILKCKLRLR